MNHVQRRWRRIVHLKGIASTAASSSAPAEVSHCDGVMGLSPRLRPLPFRVVGLRSRGSTAASGGAMADGLVVHLVVKLVSAGPPKLAARLMGAA